MVKGMCEVTHSHHTLCVYKYQCMCGGRCMRGLCAYAKCGALQQLPGSTLTALNVTVHTVHTVRLCVFLTWTHSYVAELGLFLWALTGISPKLRGRTGSCSGPVTSAAGGRTQTPRRPLVPRAMHCNQSSRCVIYTQTDRHMGP